MCPTIITTPPIIPPKPASAPILSPTISTPTIIPPKPANASPIYGKKRKLRANKLKCAHPVPVGILRDVERNLATISDEDAILMELHRALFPKTKPKPGKRKPHPASTDPLEKAALLILHADYGKAAKKLKEAKRVPKPRPNWTRYIQRSSLMILPNSIPNSAPRKNWR